MNQSEINALLKRIHWTTSEEMLFTPGRKYDLSLDKDFPMAIRFYRFTSAHPVIPNYHDFFEISYFHSGTGVYHFADRTFNIRPGEVVLIPSGIMHHVDADPEDSLKTVSVYFMPELVYQAGSTPHDYNFLLPFFSPRTARPPVFRESELGVSVWKSTLEMHAIMQGAQEYHQLDLKMRLCGILLVFLRKMMKYQNNPSKTRPAPINRIKRLDGVFNFIQAEYAKPISLKQLAGIAYMSPTYFCHFFREVTGLSPIEYVLRYRIDKAKELLISSGVTIAEIGYHVGFNSQSYFDRVFQRYTHSSPKNFRQNHSPSGYSDR